MRVTGFVFGAVFRSRGSKDLDIGPEMWVGGVSRIFFQERELKSAIVR